MSLNLLNGKIRVYNYQKNPVGFPSEVVKAGVYFTGREEDEEFVMERVLWEDIEIENNKSDVFKIGRLRFHPDEEDEVYEKLGITDRENIKSDKELIELLKDDSLVNLKYIMKLKSTLLISRMKSMLFDMERGGVNPPHLIISAVTERSEELKGSPKNPNSQIHKMIEQEKKDKEDNRLKDTLSELKREMSKLKEEKEKKEVESQQSQSALADLLDMVKLLKQENEELKKSKIAEEKTEKKTTKKAKE